MRQTKLLYKLIRRLADVVAVILLTAAVLFAARVL